MTLSPASCREFMGDHWYASGARDPDAIGSIPVITPGWPGRRVVPLPHEDAQGRPLFLRRPRSD